jgi:hypothetical protein
LGSLYKRKYLNMIKAEFVLVGYLDTTGTFQSQLDKQGEGVWLPLYIRKLLEVADANPADAPQADANPADANLADANLADAPQATAPKTRKPRVVK